MAFGRGINMPQEIVPQLKNDFKKFYNKDFSFFIDHRQIKPDVPEYSYLHWHDFFELEFVVSGKGVHTIDNLSYEIGPGSIYIVSPLNCHRVQCSQKNPPEIFTVRFDGNILSPAVLTLINDATPPITATLVATEYRFVISEMKLLIKEFKAHKPDAELMMRTLLEHICLTLLRRVEPPAQNKGKEKSPTDEPSIKRAVSYINHNFRSDISLREIAESLNLTPNYFGELFKKETGVSFNTYLKSIRLKYALNLLNNTELNISQICFESGFNTTSYFIDNFKKEYGTTPMQYRMKAKNTKK